MLASSGRPVSLAGIWALLEMRLWIVGHSDEYSSSCWGKESESETVGTNAKVLTVLTKKAPTSYKTCQTPSYPKPSGECVVPILLPPSVRALGE